MPNELNLAFPDKDHVVVTLNQGNASRSFSFVNPLTEKDHKDIRWYLETYGAHSLGDPDDKEAQRIVGQLPTWGRALFKAVFHDDSARERFSTFRRMEKGARLLTISAEHPGILALPWELLHNPADHSGFLFLENPRISIRRRVLGMDDGREAFKVEPKDHLHLLFVVSRPEGEGISFLDPRADPAAVLDALDEDAPGRVTAEFLRPPTLDALLRRLEDRSLPAVDILHFDGHGVFDETGGLPARAGARQAVPAGGAGGHLLRGTDAADQPPGTGYLLFENADGGPDFVSAGTLGENLQRQRVALVILSACQSAAVGGVDAAERPMGSVAARLTATGIPTVLAMTHSVLVPTTRTLFGQFYGELARHHPVGESLDNARRYLRLHPEKYEVQRGTSREWLQLQDWFLPALYQPGADVALLKAPAAPGSARAPRAASGALAGCSDADPLSGEGAEKNTRGACAPRSNLPPKPEAGFFGRRRDLWDIERGFAADTRRITLTGFGGQGKTALAQEAGRWLLRTGQFQAAVFVDYSQIRPADAAAVARNEIGRVLDRTFSEDGETLAALRATPTLVILDNLEALAPDALRALLEAAVPWSLAGGSRVLLTTRQPDFGHEHYQTEGTRVHQCIRLEGLGSRLAPDDALEWFASLQRLPPAPSVPTPAREALVNLFEEVRFHPLSIRILATQLKTRRPAEVGTRLGQLLADPKLNALAEKNEDTPSGLLASLTLSLDRLDATSRAVLPRLGVFQGGAFEDDLLTITGLDGSDDRAKIEALLAAVESGNVRAILQAMGKPMKGKLPRKVVARITNDIPRATTELRRKLAAIPPPTGNLWPGLRRQLEATALLEVEEIPGVAAAYLRFHPTLVPLLLTQLGTNDQARFSAAHRECYIALVFDLYREDVQTPQEARTIARRELPNILHAVHATLAAADPEAADAVEIVSRFLDMFGLRQEAENLSHKASAIWTVGSPAWLQAQSNHGEQLLDAGRVGEAISIFEDLLTNFGEMPDYERAQTLGRLGYCLAAGGRPDLAAQRQREALRLLKGLKHDELVERQRGVRLTSLGDHLVQAGRYEEARAAYEDGLQIYGRFQDLRNQGVSLCQLGILAMQKGNLDEAREFWQAALPIFKAVEEPLSEAKLWHLFGLISAKANQWEEAERHFRTSAHMKEQCGDLTAAALTWGLLATTSMAAGKLEAAESWCRKAINVDRASGNLKELATNLSNLAVFLLSQPTRLVEAREPAEEALRIQQTFSSGAAEIWGTHRILSGIAESEARVVNSVAQKAALHTEASEHRRLARKARLDFPGTRTQLSQFAPLVLATAAACVGSDDAKANVPNWQAAMCQSSPEWIAFADTLDRLLTGERDANTLCADLASNQAILTEYILAGIADPETLRDFLPAES